MPLKGVPVRPRLEVPFYFLFYGAIAQLGERLFCTQEVDGSIPLGSTIFDIKRTLYIYFSGGVA